MRALKRAYAAMAEVLAGVVLVSLCLGAAAAWVAPRWANDVLRRTAQALAARSGLQVVPPGAAPASPAPAAAVAVAAPPPPAVLPGSRLDVAALETRLRLLEGTGPILPSPAVLQDRDRGPGIDPRAWETLRGPLLAFLQAEGALPASGVEPAPALDFAAIAPPAAACFKRLEAERQQSSEKVLRTLDPGALARMLAEDDGLSEAQARQLVSRLPPASAAQVFDKLSRTAPARAARLFHAVVPAATSAPALSKRGRETHG